MTCERCAGLLVPIVSLRYEASTDYVPSGADRADLCGWRCVNCGHREDPVTVVNRRRQPRSLVEPERVLSMSYAGR